MKRHAIAVLLGLALSVQAQTLSIQMVNLCPNTDIVFTNDTGQVITNKYSDVYSPSVAVVVQGHVGTNGLAETTLASRVVGTVVWTNIDGNAVTNPVDGTSYYIGGLDDTNRVSQPIMSFSWASNLTVANIPDVTTNGDGSGTISSSFVLACITGQAAVLTWTGDSNRLYQVQVSTNLASWTNLNQMLYVGMGIPIWTADDGTSAHKFYRLRVYDSYTNFIVATAAVPSPLNKMLAIPDKLNPMLADLEALMPPMPPTNIPAVRKFIPANKRTPKAHFEKLCPMCGANNVGVDRIQGGSNNEDFHSVMFTCKCGHVYGESYNSPKLTSPPMVAVQDPEPVSNTVPAVKASFKVIKSPKLAHP